MDPSGDVIDETSTPTNSSMGKEHLFQSMIELIERSRSAHPLSSIGIGFPAVVHPDGTINFPPNLPGWGVVNLKRILEERFNLPVAIDNDANVAGLAEATLGAGIGRANFLYITLGTGVGGAIISDGKVYHGERGGAGELGHIYVSHNDSTHIVEHFVGRVGLLRLAREFAEEFPDSLLHERVSSPDFDVVDVSSACELGDEAAIECFATAGTLLGYALSSALALLDLRVVIVGGGIAKAHRSFLDTTRSTVIDHSLKTISPEFQLLHAQFQERAGVVGACTLARQAFGLG